VERREYMKMGRITAVVALAGALILCVSATAMAEEIFGTPGDDVINGGNGPDVIRALAGDDLVHGNNSRDEIYGGGGDDSLWADKGGNEFQKGGPGNDKLHDFNRGGGGTLIGGGGFDRCFVDSRDKIIDCEVVIIVD
jgi:Ca2+-binding RTX toxin-like protein